MPFLPNLSGSNIQDTFQRVLHTDGAEIYDGTGSVLLSSSELISLQALNSASVSSAEWQYIAEINQNLGTANNVQFANITASGDISASGNLQGVNFHAFNEITRVGYGAGSGNTGDSQTAIGYRAGFGNKGNNLGAIGYQAGDSNTLDNQFIVKHSGASATPLIQGNFQSGSIGIGLALPQANLHVAGNIWASGSNGHITASGNISSSGEIYGKGFHAPISINDGYHIGLGKPILSINGEGGYLSLGAGHSTYYAAGVNIYTTGSDSSKGLFLDSTGNITASANISASGTAYSLFNTSPQAHFGNSAPIPSNYQLQVTGDTFLNGDLYTNSNITASGNISASGTITAENIAVAADLTVTGNIIGASRKYELPSSTVGDFKGGDIYYYGDGSTVKGGIYYINGTNWTLADADAEASTAGLLAVALGTDPDVDGMLLRGFVTLLTEVEGTEAIGSVLYLSATDSGKATVTVPGSGKFVRVLGYSLHATENQVYFNPGSTWVEVA